MANKPAQPDPASSADASETADTGNTAQAASPKPASAGPAASGHAADTGGNSTGPDPNAGADHAGGRQSGAPALLKEILEGYLATSSLQADCQALYRSLPAVVGVASEIMKRKEAGDAAMQEGLAAVERVIGEARDKAEQLSKAMAAQQASLEALLQNKVSLTDLLKASQQNPAEKLKGFPNLGNEAAILADPKVAYQLNTLMGNINSMVAREVERQLSGLRAKATAGPSGGTQK